MAGHYGGNPYKWDGGANAPHISRYFLARGWVEPGETVLDAACATGYGSHMLSRVAGKVYGYEIDRGCIEHARKNWLSENIIFEVRDLNVCELPEVDVVVSIETIEHLDDVNHFVDQLHMKVKRLLVVSVPLGGTSWAYKNDKPGPATEKNDFMTGHDVDMLLAPDGSGWKKQADFNFGYSYFSVYFKKEPKQ